jgi:ferritin-like metal-binding protein YciE
MEILPMRLESLYDLFLDELRDIHHAESQLTTALPKMAKAASAPELRASFEEHLVQTEGHIKRLNAVFEELDESPKGRKCKAMEGLIDEAKDLMRANGAPEVIDAALISSAQRIEHYEIAGYGCLRTYARLLGYDHIADQLQQTLDEEAALDTILTEVAETAVNLHASTSGS